MSNTERRDLFLLCIGAALASDEAREALAEVAEIAPSGALVEAAQAIVNRNGAHVWGFLRALAGVRRRGEETAIQATFRRVSDLKRQSEIVSAANTLCAAAAANNAEEVERLIAELGRLGANQ